MDDGGFSLERTIERLCSYLAINARGCQRLFVLTGAGISAEAGLPTFRGENGMWNEAEVMALATRQGFEHDPVRAWTWYNRRIAEAQAAGPGPGHKALVELERFIPTVDIATQNIDGLHSKAGSANIYEIHGSLSRIKCTGCTYRDALDTPLDLTRIQHECGGLIRPDVVWFGEDLPPVFDDAYKAAQQADLILSVGTSAIVMPAAGLLFPYGNRDALVVDINPNPDLSASVASLTIPRTAGFVLGDLVARLQHAA